MVDTYFSIIQMLYSDSGRGADRLYQKGVVVQGTATLVAVVGSEVGPVLAIIPQYFRQAEITCFLPFALVVKMLQDQGPLLFC